MVKAVAKNVVDVAFSVSQEKKNVVGLKQGSRFS